MPNDKIFVTILASDKSLENLSEALADPDRNIKVIPFVADRERLEGERLTEFLGNTLKNISREL